MSSLDNFDEQLTYSKTVEPWQTGVLQLYMPGYQSHVRATESEDRAGTDYHVRLRTGRTLRVDFKHRSEARLNPKYLTAWNPDIAVEHDGWAAKAGCDYYLFTFPPAMKVVVAYLIDAQKLKARLPVLREQYGRTIRQTGGGSRPDSYCMFIPASELLEQLGRGSGYVWPYDERSVRAGTPIYPEMPECAHLPNWFPLDIREQSAGLIAEMGRKVRLPNYDR